MAISTAFADEGLDGDLAMILGLNFGLPASRPAKGTVAYRRRVGIASIAISLGLATAVANVLLFHSVPPIHPHRAPNAADPPSHVVASIPLKPVAEAADHGEDRKGNADADGDNVVGQPRRKVAMTKAVPDRPSRHSIPRLGSESEDVAALSLHGVSRASREPVRLALSEPDQAGETPVPLNNSNSAVIVEEFVSEPPMPTVIQKRSRRDSVDAMRALRRQ